MWAQQNAIDQSSTNVETHRVMNTLLEALVIITLVFLILQFLTGMWVNLFVSFPSTTQAQGFFGVMGAMMGLMQSGGGLLMIHMMMGYLIFFLSIVDLVASFITKKAPVIVTSLSGFVSVLFAGINGLLFIFSGFTNNLNSYFMATGFLLAFTSYSFTLYTLLGYR
jgi:hypothetical protein